MVRCKNKPIMLIIISLVLSLLHLYMPNAEAKNHMNVVFFDYPKITGSFLGQYSTEVNFQLWHYLGGCWGNNEIRLYDSEFGELWHEQDTLAEAVSKKGPLKFAFPIASLPKVVREHINSGREIDIVVKTDSMRSGKLFQMDNDKYRTSYN